MLGAMTFLPTFMQFVDGVSATESGLRTLPMVVGHADHLDRQRQHRRAHRPLQGLPGRGHRHHGGGFLLLSRMDATTPTWQQSLYLFVLGTGIGLCMQVLVLVVQNTSSFADLGVATSGVTFFRTIGSSFGAAIFGSLFANFLADRIGPALVASGAPPERRAVAEGAARAAAGDGRAHRRRLRRLAGHRVPVRGAGRRRRLRRRRCSSRRCRCARWTRSRRPISARASACPARSRRRRSSRSRSAGCSATPRRSGCAAWPASRAASSTSRSCGR